jgi:hypothetical protein
LFILFVPSFTLRSYVNVDRLENAVFLSVFFLVQANRSYQLQPGL